MKEANPQLMTHTDTASTVRNDQQEPRQDSGQEMQFGSFIALKRLSKLNVEAVRMQGCTDGASGTGSN